MKSDAITSALTNSLLGMLLNINTLEQACLEYACWLFQTIIQQLDDELLRMAPKGWICIGKRTRTISTMIGDIQITRRLYRKATAKEGQGGRF